MAIPAGLAVATSLPAVLQTGVGLAQWIKGNKALKNAKRPEREIPPEVLQNLSQAQVQALEGMPEAQRMAYIEDVQRSTQGGLRQLSDRRSGIAGVVQLHQNELDAQRNLMGQDASLRMANQDRLQSQRTEMGRQRDMQFDINQYQPFLDKMRMAEGLIGSGMQNMMGGVKSGSRMATDIYGYNQVQSMFEDRKNKQEVPTTTPQVSQSFGSAPINYMPPQQSFVPPMGTPTLPPANSWEDLYQTETNNYSWGGITQ